MQQSHEKTKPAKRAESEKRGYNPIRVKTLQRDKLREAKRNYWN